MNTHTWIAAFIGMGVGLAGGYVLGSAMAPVPVTHTGAMGDTMSGMTMSLEGKTGDDFDKTFLSEMIVHHQGAVTMAQAALQNAKHAEIKQLSQNIISAQEQEIDMMGGWLRSWYETTAQ
jgi:uncharacterized protein (DUF305 family)